MHVSERLLLVFFFKRWFHPKREHTDLKRIRYQTLWNKHRRKKANFFLKEIISIEKGAKKVGDQEIQILPQQL